MKRIVYPNQDGGISVIIPSDNFSVEIIAIKDVPSGAPYKIIDTVDVPSDRTFRNAWEADFSNPDGYGIGHDAWLAEQAAKNK